LVDLFLEENGNIKNRINAFLENIIRQINDDDVFGLDRIYILKKQNTERVFKGFDIRYDPIYIRKGRNGKPCIIISYEAIMRKRLGLFARNYNHYNQTTVSVANFTCFNSMGY
jgi:hypothetical protein